MPQFLGLISGGHIGQIPISPERGCVLLLLTQRMGCTKRRWMSMGAAYASGCGVDNGTPHGRWSPAPEPAHGLRGSLKHTALHVMDM